MRSSNPVLSRGDFARGDYATFNTGTISDQQLQAMYDAPPGTPVQTRRMTLDDVVVRTGLLFAVLLVTAGLAWVGNVGLVVAIVAALAAFVVAMIVSFRSTVSPALVLTYAALQGVFVGAVSHWYQIGYGANIIGQAVLGTLAAFAGMLVAYRSGVIRATPKFTKILIIAGFGYFAVALVSLVSSFFGVGGGWGFYGVGGLGVLLCVAGVALASLFLVLDFDYIEKAIAHGAPEKEAWRAGFGLMVTLVWLYLELLRLLAILRGES